MFRKNMPGPPRGRDVYWLKCHGGLGDILWLYKRVSNLDLPLFVSISNENRHRPRRSGYLVDHLPRVVGWNYDDSTFAPGGHDWTQSADDPACAMGVLWADLGVKPNVKTRLECNRWLESGRRIEDWLPDLPTTHHFAFEPCPHPPAVEFRRPCVVFHMAGWPDVPDDVWGECMDLFGGIAHVYLVGGSYDHRPRAVYNARRRRGLSLLEDVSWPDLIGVLGACDFCFGHASGFTALADVLKVRGVTYNPASVPFLNGTWNSPEYRGMLHVDRVKDFRAAVYRAYESMAGPDRGVWPPDEATGPKLAALPARSVPYAVARDRKPRRLSVYAPVDANPGLAADVLAGAIDGGAAPEAVVLVGGHPDAPAAVRREAQRVSRRPLLTVAETPSPHDPPAQLAVVVTPFAPGPAADAVRAAWRNLAAGGTLLVGGPAGPAAAESLAAGLGTRPRPVEGSGDEWWYLHRAV